MINALNDAPHKKKLEVEWEIISTLFWHSFECVCSLTGGSDFLDKCLLRNQKYWSIALQQRSLKYLSGCVRLSLEQRNVILMQCAKLPGKIQFRELVSTI